jgi:replicative DNA helicase
MTNVESLYQRIDRGRQGKNIGLKTGIPKLDEYTGGIQPLYTLIFGVSGSGKSALALYSYIYRPLKDYPDKNIKLCYFSLELSAELLLAKLLCLYIFEEYGRIIPYTDLMS